MLYIHRSHSSSNFSFLTGFKMCSCWPMYLWLIAFDHYVTVTCIYLVFADLIRNLHCNEVCHEHP